MKKEHSNFKCQVMYAQHYMLSNTRKLNAGKTRHTPGHNPFTERTIICSRKKCQMKNWMNIIRKDLRKIVKCLYYSRAIDPTMLMALKSLAEVHTKPKVEINTVL